MLEQKDYNAVFSKVHASEETRIRIMKLAEDERHSMRPVSRFILIAAAVTIFVSLFVGAYVRFVVYDDPDGMLEAIMGLNGREQFDAEYISNMYYSGGNRTALDQELAKEWIEPYIYEIGQQLVDGDTTVTFLAYLVDRAAEAGAVYIKVDNPPEYEVSNRGQVLWKHDPNSYWYVAAEIVGQEALIGNFMIAESLTDENTLYCNFLFTCEKERDLLKLWIDGCEDTISVELPMENGMPSLSLEGGDIVMTPFALKLNTKRFGINFKTLDIVSIHYKDGEEYLVEWADPIKRDPETGEELFSGPSVAYDPETGKKYYNGVEAKESINNTNFACFTDDENTEGIYFLNRVLDLDEVASITINGEVFFVDK